MKAFKHPRIRGYLLFSITSVLACCSLAALDAPGPTMDREHLDGLEAITQGFHNCTRYAHEQSLRLERSQHQVEVARLQHEIDQMCVWEHVGTDGEVIRTALPLSCSETIRSRSQPIVSSAYYSPVPGQARYATGSLEGDRHLNGQGVATADGTPPYRGVVAAPRGYSFGTMMFIPGVGFCEVRDRGGAIIGRANYDRIDVWLGRGDSGLQQATDWGLQRQEAVVFVDGDKEDIRQAVTLIHAS